MADFGANPGDFLLVAGGKSVRIPFFSTFAVTFQYNARL
jgi:hypothetical protein